MHKNCQESRDLLRENGTGFKNFLGELFISQQHRDDLLEVLVIGQLIHLGMIKHTLQC